MNGRVCFAVFLSCASIGISYADSRTVGLISHNPASDDSGYVLFSPITYSTTYLIDKCGRVIHLWKSNYLPGTSAYLRPDGSLVRAGVLGGGGSKQVTSCTEIFDWDGNLIWTYTLDSLYGQHHDFEIMPNGNLLLISHELISTPLAISAGRDPSLISGQFVSERLVEIQPIGRDSGRIVWEWRPFDHLVQDYDNTQANFGAVANHPERININFPRTAVGEWLHFNSVRYNSSLDQILVSAHHTGEIWIIDHGTTMSEASSHSGGKRGKGGDVLYRWGNPAAYGMGNVQDQKFFGQHECLWIKEGRPHAGKIIVFNNGTSRPAGMYSSVDVIIPPVDSAGNYDTHTLPMLPVSLDWSYTDNPPTKIMTQTAGGAEILPNGNVLVCTGQKGTLFELNAAHTYKVWQYVIPVNSTGPLTQGVVPTGNPVYKSVFYPFDYPAFSGKVLVPGSPIELGQANYDCYLDSTLSVAPADAWRASQVFVYPNPASDIVSIFDADHRIKNFAIYDALGRRILTSDHNRIADISHIPNGIYQLVMQGHDGPSSKTITIAR